MSPRSRVASAFAILALLAFDLACFDSPPPPETEVCETPAPEAIVDGVHVDARFDRGAQGTLMVVASVEWLGDGAPECASAELTLLDERGEVIGAQSPALETAASERGRHSTSGVFFLIDDGICRATVELESYGHTDRVEVFNVIDCPPPDAG